MICYLNQVCKICSSIWELICPKVVQHALTRQFKGVVLLIYGLLPTNQVVAHIGT